MYISEKSVDAAFSAKSCNCIAFRTGLEPSLGGVLREKAVWVDESDCIGCRYCAHVASNTFVTQKQVVAVLCDKMAIQ